MLLIISPAKLIDTSKGLKSAQSTDPKYQNIANQIIKDIKHWSCDEIMQKMKVNEKLANENYHRFQMWGDQTCREALLSFQGEVFRGIDADTLTEDGLSLAQRYLRILSGVFGVLKPLDQFEPYRLEMGIKHKVGNIESLPKFWKAKSMEWLPQAIEESPGEQVLINLASNEYLASIDTKSLQYPMIDIVFQKACDGKYKTIVVHTKKARGLMARFIIDNNIEKVEHLQAFDVDGYTFDFERSTDKTLYFIR